jgi:hypothetical protein
MPRSPRKSCRALKVTRYSSSALGEHRERKSQRPKSQLNFVCGCVRKPIHIPLSSDKYISRHQEANADAAPAIRTVCRHFVRNLDAAATNRHRQTIHGPKRNAIGRDTTCVSISTMNSTVATYCPTVDLSKYPFSQSIPVTPVN